MIKPDAVAAGVAQKIMDRIEVSGFKILRRRYYRLYPAQAEIFYGEHKGKSFFETLIRFMTSGPIWALELAGVDSIKAWRTLMGPTNTETAKMEAPDSLRAQFGTDGTRNATHGSDSIDSAAREIEFHFPPVESTLAMIKPDAVAAGEAERIMGQIEQQGFKILQKRFYQLSEEQAKQFYAEHVHKTFFPRLLDFMTSGPIWALELEMNGAIAAWRAMMGPTISTLAKDTAPMTLRSQFGTDGTMNAVHGSDSAQSAAREIAFHFQDLDNVELGAADHDPSADLLPIDTMPHIATNEKSVSEVAKEEAAASKIQEAVRERKTSQQHLTKTQAMDGSGDSATTAAGEVAVDQIKSGTSPTETIAPNLEANADRLGEQIQADHRNLEEESHTAEPDLEVVENGSTAALDTAPAVQEHDVHQDACSNDASAAKGAADCPEAATTNGESGRHLVPTTSVDIEGSSGRVGVTTMDVCLRQWKQVTWGSQCVSCRGSGSKHCLRRRPTHWGKTIYVS